MAETTADTSAHDVRKWPTLNIQRLFGLALGLKILLAGLGYAVSDALWLGFVTPLAVMLTYMVVGYNTRGSEVSEEKFADSCYYLGFIFTIASIVVCLLDVPKMSVGSGLQDIALRFGAAMVSTVLGMAVRVYLVSFRKDSSDALQDVEQALLDTTRMFTVQLQENLKTLQSFEQQVISASKSSVAGVQVQVEALSRNFSETLSQFYEQLNEENRAVFQEIADEGKAASAKLAAAVDSYSLGMQAHLASIEGKVTQFADAVSARLATTEFPDDYFAKRLKGPMDALAQETQSVGASVRAVNDEVKESAVALRGTIRSLNAKLKSSVTVMDGVMQMSERHEALLAAGEKHAQTYSGLLDRLGDIESTLKAVVAAAETTTQASGEVVTRLTGLATDSTALRETISSTLTEIAAQNAAVGESFRVAVQDVAVKLASQTSLASEVLSKVDDHTKRTQASSTSIAEALKVHAEQVAASGRRFDAVASASEGLSLQIAAVTAGQSQLIEASSKQLATVERMASEMEQITTSLMDLRPLLARQPESPQCSASSLPNHPTPSPTGHALASLSQQGMPVIAPVTPTLPTALPASQPGTNT